MRENYGVDSFDYGHDVMGSGTWRHGVTNSFTVETHAEASNGIVDGGAGGTWLLGNAGGLLSAALARSEHDGVAGSLYALGYNWRDDRFNVTFNGIRTHGDYSDVATRYGPPPPDVSAQALVGYASDYAGSFGVGYLQLRYPRQTGNRYASTYWLRSAGRRVTLNLSFNQNLHKSSDRQLSLVATIALDHNITASASMERTGNRTSYVVDASQSPPLQGGFSWRASASQGDDRNGGQAELDYLGSHGLIDAGVSSLGNTSYGYVNASGALVLMGSDVFAARHINDGFAVVSTDGIAGIPVNLENNLVGTTDRHGMLLVSPLNAYQTNQLSIDPMRLPADERIDSVDVSATPTYRAGTFVRFGITKVRAALITLHDESGRPIALGSHVTLSGNTGKPAIVGFDGAVYLDTLDIHNTLIVQTPSGICHASFDYTSDHKNIPSIGPLLCRGGSP